MYIPPTVSPPGISDNPTAQKPGVFTAGGGDSVIPNKDNGIDSLPHKRILGAIYSNSLRPICHNADTSTGALYKQLLFEPQTTDTGVENDCIPMQQ